MTRKLRKTGKVRKTDEWDDKASLLSQWMQQVKEAKDTVYGMPNGEIPEIFRSPDGESEEDSDVEFLEERTPAKRIKAIDLC